MQNGCFHVCPKVQTACLHFFLCEDDDDADDEPAQDTVRGERRRMSKVGLCLVQGHTLKALRRRAQVTNMTRGATKKLDRQIKLANKVRYVFLDA